MYVYIYIYIYICHYLLMYDNKTHVIHDICGGGGGGGLPVASCTYEHKSQYDTNTRSNKLNTIIYLLI